MADGMRFAQKRMIIADREGDYLHEMGQPLEFLQQSWSERYRLEVE